MTQLRTSSSLCYGPAPMGVLRNRPTAIVALLLAAISVAGEFAESHHHHELPGLSAALDDLATFTAGHEQPDHTLHIDGATPADPDSCFGCVGCLSQQRQLAATASPPVPGSFEPDAPAYAAESILGLGGDARRLKPSRAPPLA